MTRKHVAVAVVMGAVLTVPACVIEAGEETIARLNCVQTTAVHMERAKTRPDVYARTGFPEMVALSPQVAQMAAQTMETVCQSQVR